MLEIDFGRSVRRLFNASLAVIALLGLGHIAVGLLGPHVPSVTVRTLLSIFDLELEASVGTYVSALLILFAALAAASASALNWQASRQMALGWLATSLCLGFLSMDEAVAIHDRLAAPVQHALETGGVFFIGWIIPYAVLAVAALAVIAPLLYELDRPTKVRLSAAVTLYLFAAMGLEMIEGVVLQSVASPDATFVQAKLLAERAGDSATWDLLVTVEEILEMTAAALGMRAILLHLVVVHGLSTVRLEKAVRASLPLGRSVENVSLAKRGHALPAGAAGGTGSAVGGHAISRSATRI